VQNPAMSFFLKNPNIFAGKDLSHLVGRLHKPVFGVDNKLSEMGQKARKQPLLK
jgi:hypothetical protein